MYKFLLKNKVLTAAIIIVILTGSGAAAYFIISKNPQLKKLTSKIIKINKAEVNYYCKVDGAKVSDENLDKKPIAVMVENSSTVRPQAGLSQACMVFEALAEGGITRFLAIYAGGHKKVDKIGPVRSARPYYVSIARGFDPIYAHCGFSTRAKQKIADTGIDDFDQFKFAFSYWRDKTKKAPHNLFTSIEKLYSGAKKAGFSNSSDYDGFQFNQKKARNLPRKKQVIGIDFSYPGYYVSYEYKRETNSYDRYNAHNLQKDANNNKIISPKNVVILFAETSKAIGETLDINIEGEGKALYFISGKVIKGTWKKDNAETQLQFIGSDLNTVKLNRGQTWVEVVKTDTRVTY